MSEATSRSETPVGTGSNNTGVVRRGRKGRRKGSHLLGRSPKLSYKYAGFLKEDHGQVYLISLLSTLKPDLKSLFLIAYFWCHRQSSLGQ